MMRPALPTEDFLARKRGGLIRSGRLTDHSLPFEEVDAELLDASGNGNVGTLLSGRHITTNGVSDYVSFPSISGYNLAGTTRRFTFWYKVSAWATSGSKYLWGKGGVSNGGYLLADESAVAAIGFLAKQTGSSSNYSLVRFPRPSAGVWNYYDLTATNGVLTAASVNGVAQTLTVAVAPTGTYGDSPAGFLIGTSGNPPSGFAPGSFADLTMWNGTTEVLRARLNEHADLLAAGLNGLPAFDSSPNANHGSYVGCTGENVEGIPAEVRGLGAYEDYMWFDASNDAVYKPSAPYVTLYKNSPWFVSGEMYKAVSTFWQAILGAVGAANNNCFNFRDTTVEIRNNTGVVATLSTGGSIVGRVVSFYLSYDGAGNYTLEIDGTQTATAYVNPATLIDHPIRTYCPNFDWGGNNFNGFLKSLNVNGEFFAEGNGVTSAAWGGATVAGSPVTIGAKRRTIPQSSSIGWNKRMRFDGVDDYISVPIPGALFNYFGACTISAACLITDLSASRVLWALGGNDYRLFCSSSTGNWILNASTDTGVAVTLNTPVSVEVDYDSGGNGTALRLDGVTVWSGSAPPGGATSPVFYIGARDLGGLGAFFKGLIYDFSLSGSAVKNFAFLGTGNSNSDWLDTTGGGDNGTVSGSPTNVLVPSNDNTTDILGNTISVPRPTTSTFNGFLEGETFTVAPGSAGKSLFLWVYWDGSTAVTYLTNGSWSLAVSALGALTATSGTLYVDGAAGSTLTAGWNCVGLSHGSDITFGTLTGAGRQDRLTVYAQQLSASQQAQNYRATKGNYP